MPRSKLAHDAAVKAAVQSLLRQGAAGYSELAELSGRSPQIIRFWARQLDAESARDKHLARLWRETMRQIE